MTIPSIDIDKIHRDLGAITGPMTQDKRRDELTKEDIHDALLDKIYTSLDWENKSPNEIIAYFLAREKKMLDEIEKPLLKNWNPLGDLYNIEIFQHKQINDAIATINKYKGE